MDKEAASYSKSLYVLIVVFMSKYVYCVICCPLALL